MAIGANLIIGNPAHYGARSKAPISNQELTFVAGVNNNINGWVRGDMGTLVSNFADTPALLCLVADDAAIKIAFVAPVTLAQLTNAVFIVPGIGRLVASEATLYQENGLFEFQWSVSGFAFNEGETYTVLLRDVSYRVTLAVDMVASSQLTANVHQAETVHLAGTVSARVNPMGELATTLAGDIPIHAAPEGALRVEHRLAGELGVDVDTRGHLWPPITFRGTVGVGIDVEGDATVTRALAGSLPVGMNAEGDLTAIKVVSLAGELGVGVGVEGELHIEDAIDPDAQAIIDAMVVAPDTMRQQLISDTVVALRNAGVWGRLDVLYVLAAHDEQAAKINWANPTAHNAVAHGSPEFTPDAGYTGGALGQYLDSGFDPASAQGRYSLNNAHIGAYSTGNGEFRSGGECCINVRQSSSFDGWAMYQRQGSDALRGGINVSNTGLFNIAYISPLVGLEHILYGRSGNTTTVTVDGVQIHMNTGPAVAYGGGSFQVLRSDSDAEVRHSNRTVHAAHCGEFLQAAQASALHGALELYMDAVSPFGRIRQLARDDDWTVFCDPYKAVEG